MSEPSLEMAGELPRCSRCGYIVHGLPDERCPECGSSFSRDSLASLLKRRNLLAWEQREAGCATRRLWITLAKAWVSPGAHFSRAAERTERVIEKAGTLVWYAILYTILFHAVSYCVEDGIRVTKRCLAGHPLRSAAIMVFGPSSANVSTRAVATLGSVAADFVLIGAFAWCLKAFFRGRRGRLRTTDIMALLCPAPVLIQLLNAVALPVICACPGTLGMGVVGWLLGLMPGIGFIYLVVMVWFCCRRVMRCSALVSCALLVLCLAMMGVLEPIFRGISARMCG